ncbi:serine acetyltransferase [Mesonia sp.]|uniref:serine O-acetyltransferase n=1 Tax=Mesonia sp. TaxID=1960830 RepID=UPI00176895FB|nr:serine acetyltransferase [Mesonia sp.]HIB38458.1 serine acetyltransferase [Mesonia sp.]
MIQNFKDLKYYLKEDRRALNVKRGGVIGYLKAIVYLNFTYLFQVNLRIAEYFSNNNGLINKILSLGFKYKYNILGVICGFSIPINTFGPGLAIVHRGTIVVHHNARIGANCRIHVCTNIGATGGSDKAPIIGENVYIGPGVKIYGNIRIANSVAIAANSAVNKSIFKENVTVGGVPASIIRDVNAN